MRISDWSSDVCSSDLNGRREGGYFSADTPSRRARSPSRRRWNGRENRQGRASPKAARHRARGQNGRRVRRRADRRFSWSYRALSELSGEGEDAVSQCSGAGEQLGAVADRADRGKTVEGLTAGRTPAYQR